MELSEISAVVERNADLFRENGATSVFAFGSRARGDFRPDSDLDLFIDYDPDIHVPSLIALVGIENKLGDALGFEVHITTRDALHPLMKDQIFKDAVRLV